MRVSCIASLTDSLIGAFITAPPALGSNFSTRFSRNSVMVEGTVISGDVNVVTLASSLFKAGVDNPDESL